METNPAGPFPPGTSAVTVMGPPKSGTPRVLGMLNIVFGAALVLGGICCGINAMMQSALMPILAAQQQQMQQQIKSTQEAARAEKLSKLDEREQAATTDEEKSSIQSERQAVQSSPTVLMPVMPDMSKMYGMNDPRVLGYSIIDIFTGILFNIFLLISGAGLVAMKEWGRKMAIWVAAIKIARLVVLQTCSVIFVAPVMAKGMADTLQEMLSQMPPGPGGPPPQFGPQLTTVYGTMMTVSAICLLGFGAIYPGILLWMLTRDDAKAACQRS